MPHPSKRPTPTSDSAFPPGSVLAFLAERNQVDFELDFFTRILGAVPDYPEVLRAQASNLTTKGRLHDGLTIDKKLVTIPTEDKAVAKETPPFMRWNSAFLNPPGAFETRAKTAFYYITLPDPSWKKKEQEEPEPEVEVDEDLGGEE